MTNNSKHPKGLWYLFFTEMWERFGYYLMLGIFSLYMLDSLNNGGMGFSAAKKSDIYGTYLGLVYLTPFIGGLIGRQDFRLPQIHCNWRTINGLWATWE
jgi:proton-dependent oligopeptide transporter, POT family